MKWWQKQQPNSKDLPLKMYVNGEYHATFNDILTLDFVKSEFESAGYTIELKGDNNET
jgi:hypothetical protein|tara:strand:- start:8 stop:181 length:174 start_codon:yes stop_codon:yes gene_type:complete